MTQLSEAYRKIRNTFRFALGNLDDFDPSRDALPNDQLEEMDRWMLERTADLVPQMPRVVRRLRFSPRLSRHSRFCIVDLSSFYFDVLKDRLYTKAPRNNSRRSAQTAVWKISSALVRLLAPILVFTTEEIWKMLPKSSGKRRAQRSPDGIRETPNPAPAASPKTSAEQWSRSRKSAPPSSKRSKRPAPQKQSAAASKPKSSCTPQREAQSQAEGISASAPGALHRLPGRFFNAGPRRQRRSDPRPRSTIPTPKRKVRPLLELSRSNVGENPATRQSANAAAKPSPKSSRSAQRMPRRLKSAENSRLGKR